MLGHGKFPAFGASLGHIFIPGAQIPRFLARVKDHQQRNKATTTNASPSNVLRHGKPLLDGIEGSMWELMPIDSI